MSGVAGASCGDMPPRGRYMGHKKTSPRCAGRFWENWMFCFQWRQDGGLFEPGLACAAHGAEPLLELVDAALGVDELFLPGEEGVGVRGDA